MRMFNNNQRQTGAPQTPKTSNAQSSASNNNTKQNPQANSSRNTSQNQNANTANKPLQRSSSLFGIRNNTNVTNNSENKAVPTNVNQKKANNPIQNNSRSNNINQNNTNSNSTQVNSRVNNRQQNQPVKKANESSSTQQAVSQIIKNVVNTKQYTNAPATNYSHSVQPTVQNNKSGGNPSMHNTSASASEINKSSVFDNPVFKGIEPAKMAFIKDMISEMDGKKQDAKPQLLMTYVMRMRQEGFSFSPEELSAVTAALRPTMSDEENKQFDNFANLMKNMHR